MFHSVVTTELNCVSVGAGFLNACYIDSYW